ncbi:MAG: hypothetical protein V4549_15355 [Bacteroidota bacterium]
MSSFKHEKLVNEELKQEKEFENVSDKTSTASKFFYSRMDNFGKPKKLTINQVRSNVGFSDISEQDANEIIDGLYKLSIISYNIFNYGTGKL